MRQLWLREEDSRPRMFWFEFDNGSDAGDVFFMGEIPKEIRKVEKLGFEVVNKDEFKNYL